MCVDCSCHVYDYAFDVIYYSVHYVLLRKRCLVCKRRSCCDIYYCRIFCGTLQAKMHWGDVVGADLSRTTTIKQQYIDIPVNVRYGVGLGSLANVFVFAGPQWGINVGDENFKWDERSSYSLRKATFSVNVGAGVTLFKHLQGSVNYNIECNKSGKMDTERTNHKWVKGRNNTWQISLGYWF